MIGLGNDTPLFVAASALVVIWGVFWVIERRIASRFRVVARMARTLILPCFAVLWLFELVFGISRSDSSFKLVETILGFTVVWTVALTLQALYLSDKAAHSIRGRTPLLLVDIVRIVFVVIGMVMVYSGVWQKDVSPLLTTFGVGSLVLGLALQDTLGNLFSGLALVFERPLCVGDWIQIGDTAGKVQQINWRSVRIVTRELNEITIPNIAIGKDRILNFSNPTRVHGFKVTVGFSYDAPPNAVKEMLFATALNTPGILSEPAPEARTLEFAAYSISYELRVFIADYENLTQIRNELMTRVWYAAQRNGITIPYPITTLYKTEVPYSPSQTSNAAQVLPVLRANELFRDLSDGEAQTLAAEVKLERYAAGETLIREGSEGDCFYIVVNGRCSVFVNADGGQEVSVASIERGSVIGEMSLLAGTPRSATVIASSDVLAARIGKEALSHLLSQRQELLKTFAHYAAGRSKEIDVARLQQGYPSPSKVSQIDEMALGERIRRFFGLR